MVVWWPFAHSSRGDLSTRPLVLDGGDQFLCLLEVIDVHQHSRSEPAGRQPVDGSEPIALSADTQALRLKGTDDDQCFRGRPSGQKSVRVQLAKDR